MANKKITVAKANSQASNLQIRAQMKAKSAKTDDTIPMMEASAAATDSYGNETNMRRNAASTIERTSRFANIDNGLVPFRYSSSIYGANRSSIDVRDAVVLCQKCYYNFALFRNIIDLMTEFSVGNITLKGGSQLSRDLFSAWMKKINMDEFQDKHYREYYRSGNVFSYRFDANIKPQDIKKIIQTFASEIDQITANIMDTSSPKASDYIAETVVKIRPDKLVIEPMTLPARYIILNPADIQMMSTLNFAYGIYFKIMTDYEIARLRNPTTEEDVAVFKDLPKEVQRQIKTGSRTIAIPLDPTKVGMVFYKKQDYEPFAVPMGYPVLEDINFKAELKKIDMAIARTMQQIVLLVTTGTEPEKGGVNQKYINALTNLFKNQSVGRVLIADYTTKAEFVVPAIADLLDPKKYEIVNDDINIGLNNVFAGGDKFANQQQKVELFISRLEQARKSFLNNFLIPEFRRIAKSLNLKNYPTPEYEDIELKDNATLNKIYARLMEIGLMTPEQGYTAIKTGVLPDPAQVKEAQEAYKKDRDAGLYVPLVGGGAGQDAGRPDGSKSPQTTKTVGPIGTSKASTPEPVAETKFSVTKVGEHLALAQELDKVVVNEFRKLYNVKSKRLTNLQKQVVDGTVALIVANETPDKWIESAASYTANPEDKNHARVLEVNKIAATHQLDNFLAGILIASKAETNG